ncbi:hypothetical protein HCH_04891 [Hahella chejuensis KCTC 2396]|uniref:Uncharacterized protein n=1 Tax=Hahella chejuensis (strain KCTC 2396) TaxID=349521 RepID=Q2SCP2_HAHCH|nr:hypothetical protein HCH_04891 [Hahella chejuensis KCTC 2396]
MENQRLAQPFSLDKLERCLHRRTDQLVANSEFWRHLQTLD